MKTATLKLNHPEIAILYRGLLAQERDLKRSKTISPAVLAMSLVSVNELKDKLAITLNEIGRNEKKGATA